MKAIKLFGKGMVLCYFVLLIAGFVLYRSGAMDDAFADICGGDIVSEKSARQTQNVLQSGILPATFAISKPDTPSPKPVGINRKRQDTTLKIKLDSGIHLMTPHELQIMTSSKSMSPLINIKFSTPEKDTAKPSPKK